MPVLRMDLIPYLHMSILRLREGNSLVQGHTARTHRCYSSLEKSRLWLTWKSWHLGEGLCMTPEGSLWFWACASIAFTWPVGSQQIQVGDLRQKMGRKVCKDEGCGFTS